MATVFTPSNNMLSLIHQGTPDFATDNLKAVLMQSGFTFNRAAQSLYTDISGSELPAGNGYTTGGADFTGVNTANIKDDANDQSDITWNDVVWTAVGTLGPTPGAIIIDSTLPGGPIVGYHDFGGDTSVTDDNLTLQNPLSRIGGA